MQIHAQLENKHVLVTKPKDVGRLFSKSRIGTPLPKNTLQLSLLEAAFLCEQQKITIHDAKGIVTLKDLVHKAAELYSSFDLLFLVYRDLRKRGQCVQENIHDLENSFIIKEQSSHDQSRILVKVFSERDFFDVIDINKLLNMVESRETMLWFAIADEEGDITYYSVTRPAIKGVNVEASYGPLQGYLLGERVILFDEQQSVQLLKKEFYGKPFGSGLQLSLVEALYLMQKKTLTLYDLTSNAPVSDASFEQQCTHLQPDILQRLHVFQMLKKQGLIVKTGFKFGTHFRAYTQHPDDTHAEYLIHTVPSDFRRMWAEMSRAVRLAHTVNKEILFAPLWSDGSVSFISLGRLRP